MRFLGLDIGQRNIGVAAGEALAQELTTLQASKIESFYEDPARQRALGEIEKLMAQEGADAVVAGLPVKEDGSPSEESVLIKAFGDTLQDRLNCRVYYVNETLTSYMAEDILDEQRVSATEKATRIHQLAAQLILQQYLEENALS